jgi:uncharacterized membrane protein YtjA (UPF0391 family)
MRMYCPCSREIEMACLLLDRSSMREYVFLREHEEEILMLKWAIIFFVISVIAGFFGFTNIAVGAKSIAKILFYISLVIFIIVLIFGVVLGKLVF